MVIDQPDKQFDSISALAYQRQMMSNAFDPKGTNFQCPHGCGAYSTTEELQLHFLQAHMDDFTRFLGFNQNPNIPHPQTPIARMSYTPPGRGIPMPPLASAAQSILHDQAKIDARPERIGADYMNAETMNLASFINMQMAGKAANRPSIKLDSPIMQPIRPTSSEMSIRNELHGTHARNSMNSQKDELCHQSEPKRPRFQDSSQSETNKASSKCLVHILLLTLF